VHGQGLDFSCSAILALKMFGYTMLHGWAGKNLFDILDADTLEALPKLLKNRRIIIK